MNSCRQGQIIYCWLLTACSRGELYIDAGFVRGIFGPGRLSGECFWYPRDLRYLKIRRDGA